MSTKADKLSTIGPVLADIFGHWCNIPIFSTRCNIYISPLCYDVSVRLSVRLSVTEVHWCKFRSKFTAHCGRGACGREH